MNGRTLNGEIFKLVVFFQDLGLLLLLGLLGGLGLVLGGGIGHGGWRVCVVCGGSEVVEEVR